MNAVFIFSLSLCLVPVYHIFLWKTRQNFDKRDIMIQKYRRRYIMQLQDWLSDFQFGEHQLVGPFFYATRSL